MNIDRNKYIIEQLNQKLSTMQSLAEEFKISRQRISEIYYKYSGNHRGYLKFQKKVQRDVKKEEKLDSTKFNCANCGRKVSYRLSKHKSKYCDRCHESNDAKQRDLNITLACEVCRKEYHPYRTKITQHNYCSRECFHQSRIVGPLWMNKKYAEKMAAKGNQ